MSLVLAGLLLFGCCVCFWSVRDPEARRRGGGGEGCEEVDSRRAGLYGVSEVSDAEAPTYRSAKYLEDGLSVGRGMMAVIPVRCVVEIDEFKCSNDDLSFSLMRETVAAAEALVCPRRS